MNARTTLIFLGLTLLIPRIGVAQEPARSAVLIPAQLVASGLRLLETVMREPEDVAWLTDVDEAVKRAQEEHKPILLQLYLTEPVDPTDKEHC